MTVPYHPKEMGHGADWKPIIRSGLWGAFTLVVHAGAGLVVAVVCLPFVVLGVAEFVGDTSVSSWRVRWVRRS